MSKQELFPLHPVTARLESAAPSFASWELVSTEGQWRRAKNKPQFCFSVLLARRDAGKSLTMLTCSSSCCTCHPANHLMACNPNPYPVSKNRFFFFFLKTILISLELSLVPTAVILFLTWTMFLQVTIKTVINSSSQFTKCAIKQNYVVQKNQLSSNWAATMCYCGIRETSETTSLTTLLKLSQQRNKGLFQTGNMNMISDTLR